MVLDKAAQHSAGAATQPGAGNDRCRVVVLLLKK
jgi:hypothetical protein